MIALLIVSALLQASPPAQRTIERGTMSYIDTPRQVTARTPDEWQAVWMKHSPNRPLPQVDFDREMVVGVFVGSRATAGYSVEIVGVEEQQGALVVRYRETVPRHDAVTAQVITTPYHLIAVPKFAGQVRFEKVP